MKASGLRQQFLRCFMLVETAITRRPSKAATFTGETQEATMGGSFVHGFECRARKATSTLKL
eukprot:9026292-Karenia_brevis.AAC.1